MNYLALCRAVSTMAGINSNGPTTVVGQAGEMKRVCLWVSQAWEEIQEYHNDWEWMRKTFSFATVANQSSYAPATDVALTDFAAWRNDSFRMYLASAGVGNEIWLQQYDYNSFRDYYLLGARKITYARPIAISVAPDKSLVLGLAPDQVYTVSGEYYKVPQALTADADIPEMPPRFHMAIVHKALMKYGQFEGAGEVTQEHAALYATVMNRLELDQLPPITIGGSLI